ncbi:MAG: transglutaminase domain-containing protein [Planctomycetia bacterium]|nr:transglutaminase domain-containing protein [Planctomycetia bacterium]
MITKAFNSAVVLAAVALTCTHDARADNTTRVPANRTFRLNYGATLTGLSEGQKVRVWLPVPRADEYQQVEPLASLLPSVATIADEPTYGNSILYFETSGSASGNLAFQTSYRITRSEVRTLLVNRNATSALTETQRKLFLAPNRMIPLDGKPLELLREVELPSDPLALCRVLYDRVDDHVKYDKSQPGYGAGDVNWVCDSRFGNCTDFHSLFISLSRSRGVPAQFEIGFPLPEERGAGAIGGYRCGAYFHTDRHGWLPVDISEADKHPELKEYYFGNLTENRVTFTSGRDIDLVPRQAGKPLNYFVYPYAEVDGKPLPKEQMDLNFSYEDEST